LQSPPVSEIDKAAEQLLSRLSAATLSRMFVLLLRPLLCALLSREIVLLCDSCVILD
jgi:hypothetical protein